MKTEAAPSKNSIALVRLAILIAMLWALTLPADGQPYFYKQYWVSYSGTVNNNKQTGERTRVNDKRMSSHPQWEKRFESQVNGLALLNIPDTISHFLMAELFCEMWGGHPKTANKRFSINGGEHYPLPSEATQAGNCEYIFPKVKIDPGELVRGTNAIQFNCDRGSTFWGHFLMEEICINGYFAANSVEVRKEGLKDFHAAVVLSEKKLSDQTILQLQIDPVWAGQIEKVYYMAHYTGFDDSGSGRDENWHGYQFKREFTNIAGASGQYPYQATWNTTMIPDQGKPMSIKAVVRFKNGFYYETEALTGLSFPASRARVKYYYCTQMPHPFWSRDGQLLNATIELPDDIALAEKAELIVRCWDGGEGAVKEPFKLNGLAVPITRGNAPHDLVYTANRIETGILKPGLNQLELLSDTEHHGLEICMPGPCLIVRYKKEQP